MIARAILGVTAAAVLSVTVAASAQTQPPTPTLGPEALFQKGSAALSTGEYNAAIDALEALADRGFVHPDASFDRGLAYLERVRANADKPGDLGRAAAGFEEALQLRPDDAEAEAALDMVRAEVTRRRARRAKDSVDARPTLDRAIVGLASERTWSIAALLASLSLALGMILRRRPERRVHVTGSVLASSAAIALLVLLPITWGARELRLTRRAGVIVVPEVYLNNDEGQPLRDPVPEAAAVEVEVGARRGATVRVRWGATEGWAPAGSVRLLGP